MAIPTMPRSWWGPLLWWWLICAVSVGGVWLLAPKRYTATATMLAKQDRIPWQGFSQSKLPRADEEEDDLRALMKEQGLGEDSLTVWQEPTFAFLMDQLAFDAYDFRPFLYSWETTLEAAQRSGYAVELGVGEIPPDLLAITLGKDLEAEFDEQKGLLTLAFTADSPAAAEGMVAAYQELLDAKLNQILDEKDRVTMQRLGERLTELRSLVADLEGQFRAFEERERITAPTKFLTEGYLVALSLRERAARQQAVAEAAGYYLDALEGETLDPESGTAIPRVVVPGQALMAPQLAEELRSTTNQRIPLKPRRPLVVDPQLTALR
ncbi:MAG TPA: hypothetical protein VEI97_00035, partial [bacterium]|nr:hypothetical protein [bacterium]